MTSSCVRAVLRECSTELTADLSPEPAINYFWANKIITDMERDYIRTISPSKISQAGELLDVLRTKGDKALDELIKYLENDGTQPHMLGMLRDSIEKYSKDAKPKPAANTADPNSDFARKEPKFDNTPKSGFARIWDRTVSDWITEHRSLKKHVDVFEIDNLSETKNINKIRRTLQWWTLRMEATFSNLWSILSGCGNASRRSTECRGREAEGCKKILNPQKKEQRIMETAL